MQEVRFPARLWRRYRVEVTVGACGYAQPFYIEFEFGISISLFECKVTRLRIPGCAAEDGHCVWYGVCTQQAFTIYNCAYNGTAQPIDNASMVSTYH
ncbi:hypothetical protein RR48_10559 [Papilio machaon]|uniref:Uncharacterized protein n=1 Tax=Papilio machaon TaxID=76193 RepID=A0A194RMR0_PAPMA|nr:hypothetical protein RR48_10559 [Papilio machaon]